MCFATVFGFLMMHLIGVQVQQAFGCTFTPYQDEFAASVKYEILKRSERECLQVCYEEPDCTFVQFVQLITGVCTIYKNGSETQNLTGVVYSIDRQVVIPNCSQPLPVASKVEVRNVSDLVENHEAELDGPLDQNLTTIYAFSLAERTFFSPNDSLFPDGTKQITSGRIYAGKVYNVTGYTFMHAYAFADHCKITGCAGTRCGITPVAPKEDGSLHPSLGKGAIYVADLIEISTGKSFIM